MQNLYVASKHSGLANYLFLFLRALFKHCEFRLVPEYNKNIDLMLIDVETTMPNECKKLMGKHATLLFTRMVKPQLISYTSILDINGVISLDMEPEKIQKTLEKAIKKEIYYHEEMISLLFSSKVNESVVKIKSITNRELDIIRLMLKDMTNEEIAKQLQINIRTVNTHKNNIMRKTGVKTASGLVKMIVDYFPNIID